MNTKKIEIILNDCYGGFGISDFGMEKINELKKKRNKKEVESWYDIDRWDNELIEVFKTYGEKINKDEFSKLSLETASGKFQIAEYDGLEYIITLDSFLKQCYDTEKIIKNNKS